MPSLLSSCARTSFHSAPLPTGIWGTGVSFSYPVRFRAASYQRLMLGTRPLADFLHFSVRHILKVSGAPDLNRNGRVWL